MTLALSPPVWMIAGSLATCLAVLAAGGGAVMPEAAIGMAAPLVSAVASWLVIQHVHATAPARLTNVLMVSFVVKALLFGAYVVVALTVLDLRPVPFIASFTGYYGALHLGEALLLKRLLAAGGRTLAAAADAAPHN
jgi:hypothetical protein